MKKRRIGEVVELTPKEFALLVCLVQNPRQVFTRTHLLDVIWGYDFIGDTRTVAIHVQLRDKDKVLKMKPNVKSEVDYIYNLDENNRLFIEIERTGVLVYKRGEEIV
ncbi:MAG: winged helix-turn-helix domain-containing protein [Lachnospiraceae bacterium]|nr:winged helix-turn-helix domain-containing protein [Lachnospiraceae bacterium]